MATLNYIDENGNINKAGVIPKNYPASNIGYDNSQSGLSATKVQGAIDELQSEVKNIADLIKYGLQRILLKWESGYTSKAISGTANGYASFLVAFFQQNGGSGLYAINITNGNITMTHLVGLDNTQSALFHNEYDTTEGLRFRLSSARPYETEIFIFGLGV